MRNVCVRQNTFKTMCLEACSLFLYFSWFWYERKDLKRIQRYMYIPLYIPLYQSRWKSWCYPFFLIKSACSQTFLSMFLQSFIVHKSYLHYEHQCSVIRIFCHSFLELMILRFLLFPAVGRGMLILHCPSVCYSIAIVCTSCGISSLSMHGVSWNLHPCVSLMIDSAWNFMKLDTLVYH